MNKQALIELAKSFGRFLWFGLLALVATFLLSLTTNADLLSTTWTVNGLTMPLGVWIVAAIGFAVKAIDKYVHENKDLETKGLAPGFLQK